MRHRNNLLCFLLIKYRILISIILLKWIINGAENQYNLHLQNISLITELNPLSLLQRFFLFLHSS